MSEQIKETEIMIGNYIRDIWSDNGFFKVTELRKDKVFYGNSFKAEYKNIRPIPLTEDILLKCGVRKVNHIHGYSFFTFSNSKINKAHIDIYEKKTCYYGSYVAKCKYLHQIQNLFKAITQTDLKVEV